MPSMRAMYWIRPFRVLLLAYVTGLLAACSATPTDVPSNSEEFSWNKKLATPGAEIRFENTSESGYTMFVSGLPEDKQYHLWFKRLDGKTGSFQVPNTSTLFSTGMVFKFRKFRRGQPMDYALVSTDGTPRAYATLIPYPIEAISEQGCRLSAKMLLSNGRLFVITAEGFEPGERAILTSRSGDTSFEPKERRIGKNGRFFIVLDPTTEGRSGDTTTVGVSSKSCDVTLRFKWGTDMEELWADE